MKAQQGTGKCDIVESELNEKIASIEKFSDNCMTEMNGIFAKVDDRRRVRILL